LLVLNLQNLGIPQFSGSFTRSHLVLLTQAYVVQKCRQLILETLAKGWFS